MLPDAPLAVRDAMLIVMLGAWAFCLAARNGGWTDVFWTFGSGACLVFAAIAQAGDRAEPLRQGLVACMCAAWALRLGLYLAPRVARHPEDARYAAFRRGNPRLYPLKMLFVALPQAFATALLSVSVALAAARPGHAPDLRDAAGLALFCAALVGETKADRQMRRFRADPANHGQVLDSGMWSWSRHPNYVFQWLGWLAYPVMALDPSQPITWMSLAAPAGMYLLLRYVSGVPPLERAMLESRGEAFRAYQERVPVFLPFPVRARSA